MIHIMSIYNIINYNFCTHALTVRILVCLSLLGVQFQSWPLSVGTLSGHDVFTPRFRILTRAMEKTSYL